MADGHGINRLDVMYNDFILVGPTADPAGVKGQELAKDAFAKIAEAGSTFASRGDDSGTHTKEKSIWSSDGITPTTDSGWYLSVGQGMGETLNFANEKQSYTLTDRGTWLSMKENLSELTVIVGGETIDENKDKALLNPYGVIPVNPETHPGVNFELATHFAEWLTSARNPGDDCENMAKKNLGNCTLSIPVRKCSKSCYDSKTVGQSLLSH